MILLTFYGTKSPYCERFTALWVRFWSVGGQSIMALRERLYTTPCVEHGNTEKKKSSHFLELIPHCSWWTVENNWIERLSYPPYTVFRYGISDCHVHISGLEKVWRKVWIFVNIFNTEHVNRLPVKPSPLRILLDQLATFRSKKRFLQHCVDFFYRQ